MKRINPISTKLVLKTSKTNKRYMLVYFDGKIPFYVSTRNTQIEERLLKDVSITEIPLYIELQEAVDKNNKPYLKIDLFAENEKYLFSVYVSDKNLSFMFNLHVKSIVYELLSEKERDYFGVIL